MIWNWDEEREPRWRWFSPKWSLRVLKKNNEEYFYELTIAGVPIKHGPFRTERQAYGEGAIAVVEFLSEEGD